VWISPLKFGAVILNGILSITILLFVMDNLYSINKKLLAKMNDKNKWLMELTYMFRVFYLNIKVPAPQYVKALTYWGAGTF